MNAIYRGLVVVLLIIIAGGVIYIALNASKKASEDEKAIESIKTMMVTAPPASGQAVTSNEKKTYNSLIDIPRP